MTLLTQTCMLESQRMLLPSARRDTNICEFSIADTLPIRELVSSSEGPLPSSSFNFPSILVSLPSSIVTVSIGSTLTLSVVLGWVSGARGDKVSSSIEGREEEEENEGSRPSTSWLSCSLGLRIGEMRGGEAQQRTLGLGLGLALCWGSLR